MCPFELFLYPLGKYLVVPLPDRKALLITLALQRLKLPVLSSRNLHYEMPNALRSHLIQVEMQSLVKKQQLLQQEHGTDLIVMNGVMKNPSENPT